MPTRDQEIASAESDIEFLQRKLNFYRHIMHGRIYQFENARETFIGIPIRFNKYCIVFEVIASATPIPSWVTKKPYTNDVRINSFATYKHLEVKFDELALYLGWAYVSPKLAQMIKRGYISRETRHEDKKAV